MQGKRGRHCLHMTAPSEPDPLGGGADELLVDLLDECLRAEQARAGSSRPILEAAPEQLRPELAQLLFLGQALRGNPPYISASTLAAMRARIMQCIEPT